MAVAAIEREFLATQAVCALGAPCPAAIELIEVGGRRGIVFERVRGISLWKRLERQPWKLFAGACQLAELHARIHSFMAPTQLRSQSDQLSEWIDEADEFTPAQKQIARQHVARLPAGSALCHGDFHPGNILLSESGPKIIDWSVATRGHPLADLARTSVLFESADMPSGTPVHIRLLVKVARRLLHRTYLKRYFELCSGDFEELECWRVPQRMAGSAWRAARRKGSLHF